jgi:ribosome-associated toxin RatA of RatAB toxin-antitoxin module
MFSIDGLPRLAVADCHHAMSAGFQEANRRHCEEPATKLRSNFALERRSNPWRTRIDGLLRFARNDVEARVPVLAAGFRPDFTTSFVLISNDEASLARHRMQLGQLVERQFCILIRQLESDDDVLTSKLPPKPIRGPFLRLRSAWTLEPNQIPLGHDKRPLASSIDRRRKLRAPEASTPPSSERNREEL